MEKTLTYLPKGWELTTLEEVAIIVTGNTPPTSNVANFNGDVPFFKPSDLNVGHVNDSKEKLSILGKELSRTLPKGSTLVTCIGSTIGKAGIISKEGAFNQQINGVLPIISNPLFFYYQIISPNFQKSIIENSSATTVPILNKNKFGKLPFLMAPLSEQNQIVDKIDGLFEELNAAENSLQAADRLLSKYEFVILKEAFEGRLTEEWRRNNIDKSAMTFLKSIAKRRKEKFDVSIKNVNHQLKRQKSNHDFEFYQDKNISSWAKAKLEKLITISARVGWKGLKREEYTTAGPLFLSVHSLNHGKIVSFDEAFHISEERYRESPEIMVQPEDVLLCKDGAGIGKVGIVKHLPSETTINSSLLIVRGDDVFNSDFLYYLFKGPQIQKLVNDRVSGSAIPHLFQKDIKEFILSVPPMEEQMQIVQEIEYRFTIVENLKNAIRENLKRADTFKQIILNSAYSGKLIGHDNSEESISVLLERISEEKAVLLEAQKEIIKSKPKVIKLMEEKKSILQVLESMAEPISAKEVWLQSKHKDDIEAFYSELREIQEKIVEIKKDTESLLSLRP